MNCPHCHKEIPEFHEGGAQLFDRRSQPAQFVGRVHAGEFIFSAEHAILYKLPEDKLGRKCAECGTPFTHYCGPYYFCKKCNKLGEEMH